MRNLIEKLSRGTIPSRKKKIAILYLKRNNETKDVAVEKRVSKEAREKNIRRSLANILKPLKDPFPLRLRRSIGASKWGKWGKDRARGKTVLLRQSGRLFYLSIQKLTTIINRCVRTGQCSLSSHLFSSLSLFFHFTSLFSSLSSEEGSPGTNRSRKIFLASGSLDRGVQRGIPFAKDNITGPRELQNTFNGQLSVISFTVISPPPPPPFLPLSLSFSLFREPRCCRPLERRFPFVGASDDRKPLLKTNFLSLGCFEP